MMMMMGGTSSSSSSSSNVFTAAQWEELEQQALIYKYMVSGVPVPTHLILSVRRSLYNSSSSLSSNHPTSNLGVWEGSSFPYNQLYQIGGYGRKIDLEPGRCRRTDGKKWRCSKEAYPDSKYCERHMHRGRNRSRKPVEFPSSSSAAASSSTVINVSSSSPSSTISKSTSHSDHTYPPPFSSTFVDSHHQTLKDNYRQLQGMKDLGEDDQRSAANYFGQLLNDPYTSTTHKMSSDHNYSHFNFENLKDEQKKQEGGQHCFVMGTDFIKPSEDTKATSKQPFHHFFSTPKATILNPTHDPNWVEADPKAPLSTQDLFQSKPRPYW